MPLSVRVFHNGDHATLAWGPQGDPRAQIPGCVGFKLLRKSAGQPGVAPTVIKTFASFDLKNQAEASNTSDVWPIQKYHWFDYSLAAPNGAGPQYQYRLVGLTGAPGALTVDPNLDSGWTDPVTVSSDCGDGISCYFNRGIVAAQWVARALEAKEGAGARAGTELTESISTKGDLLRNELSGLLRVTLLDLLDQTNAQGGVIFAALYELDGGEAASNGKPAVPPDPELIPAILKFGNRANVILANGAFNAQRPDENAAARQALTGKVNLFPRMVSEGHFAHNKFLVLCDAARKPQSVWTGSTNWTKTGLCTQANNGILIQDPAVAECYLDQWERLRLAGNDFPDSLKQANSQQKTFAVGNSQVTVWFVPTLHQEDLAHAAKLIRGAQDGILFLMFEPGGFEQDPQKWTLLQWILSRHDPGSPYYNKDVYLRGVVNQEIPMLTAAAKLDPTHPAAHPVALIDSGSTPAVRLSDEVEVPVAVVSKLGHWNKELMNQGVKIHSKLIVIDPFGQHPVVMTGSHNMGYKASTMNDDNLMIIENNRALAEAYAANVLSIFQQYRDNALENQTPNFGQLTGDDSWQATWFQAPLFADINFVLKGL